MKQIFKLLAGLLIAVLLASCGGGGGSAGSTNGGGVTPAAASMTLALVTSTGTATTVINNLDPVFAKATVVSATGTPLVGQVVTFTTDGGLIRFLPASGTALTDSSGVATIQVLPASASSAGAGTLQADTAVGSLQLTKTLTFTVPAGSSDTATSRVKDFALLLDKSTLPNGSAGAVKVTVVAVDATNNVVPGATISIATDASTIFTPTNLVTDASGSAGGTVSQGSDKTDRTVTVTATVNGIVRQTTFLVSGSQIALTLNPPILTQGGASTLTAKLTDSVGAAIASKSLTFTSDIAGLNGRTGTTDATGSVALTFTAPTVPGSYLITVSGSGVNKQLSAQVGASTTIPNAVLPLNTIPSLAAIPNVLAPNLSGSTTNQSQLKFLAINADNAPVPNVRVRFKIASTGLGSTDSTISTGNSIVYTNSSGIATAAFVPGPTGSPTDGVVIQACYSDTDFAVGTCPRGPVEAHLTIAAQALAVSIGDDDKQTTLPNGIYSKVFVITVADAAGRAVANAPVDISLDITHYGKGQFEQALSFPLGLQDYDKYVPADYTESPTTFGARVSCINEDKNRNGFADPGENLNGTVDSFGQATLEPRRSDLILAYVDPLVTTTNASGVLLVKVDYSMRFATWLSYRLRATTSVAGSQGSAERQFYTKYTVGDEVTGSFKTPPYGSGACNSPN